MKGAAMGNQQEPAPKEIGEPVKIFESMRRVLEDLPALGKDQRNKEQGFDFRGIESILNALHPLLAKHGVIFVPDVLERLESVRETSTKKSMYVVNLHVRYTFFGPDGSWIQASGWGEGTDMGDKATNKAMTGAMKYVLSQVFAIASAGNEDSDASSPEESRPKAAEKPAWAMLFHELNRWAQGDVEMVKNFLTHVLGDAYPGRIDQLDDTRIALVRQALSKQLEEEEAEKASLVDSETISAIVEAIERLDMDLAGLLKVEKVVSLAELTKARGEKILSTLNALGADKEPAKA